MDFPNNQMQESELSRHTNGPWGIFEMPFTSMHLGTWYHLISFKLLFTSTIT